MPEPSAYLNGQYVPVSQAVLPVNDAGFVQGTTVAEQMRTFGGKLFRLEAHIERLFHSLAILGVDPGLTQAQFVEIAAGLATRNHSLLAQGDDLNLTLFVTPGVYGPMATGNANQATVCMHTFPMRFDLWAKKYRTGEALATTEVRQVSSHCWPPELKCRSRMHYFLADRQARERFPGSRALMLDDAGYITEATTANLVLFVQGEGLVTPPAAKILPGISLAVLTQIAGSLGIPHVQRDLRPADLAGADEAWLTSTSPCMLPVAQFNGHPIGDGTPGAQFKRLLTAWGELVSVDIIGQADQFSVR